jgi:hypothetical protein
MMASQSGIATSPVLVARRTVGRGTQIITITGEDWRYVQREASAVWYSADEWLRQPRQPVAIPTTGGGFTATVWISDAE